MATASRQSDHVEQYSEFHREQFVEDDGIAQREATDQGF